MKVLKIMTTDGRIYHMPLPGFPDAAQVELLDMTRAEYQAVPPSMDAHERCTAMLAD